MCSRAWRSSRGRPRATAQIPHVRCHPRKMHVGPCRGHTVRAFTKSAYTPIHVCIPNQRASGRVCTRGALFARRPWPPSCVEVDREFVHPLQGYWPPREVILAIPKEGYGLHTNHGPDACELPQPSIRCRVFAELSGRSALRGRKAGPADLSLSPGGSIPADARLRNSHLDSAALLVKSCGASPNSLR